MNRFHFKSELSINLITINSTNPSKCTPEWTLNLINNAYPMFKGCLLIHMRIVTQRFFVVLYKISLDISLFLEWKKSTSNFNFSIKKVVFKQGC